MKYKCAAAFYGQAAHERLDDADRSPAAQMKPVADSSFDIRAGALEASMAGGTALVRAG
ncbi:hypothetical protein [Caballeronia humi]|uniref:hypothetical protein n=1 Tax=Caballeronia humi TaxID=326474 RepID=UPI000AB51568|nr:hypothetical protein [Caballeronia humi]